MQQMLAQVQKMQQDMAAAQEAAQARDRRGVGRRGHGHREGDRRPAGPVGAIDPEAVDPEDVDILSDMVLAAVNEALRAAQELAATKLSGVTGGLDAGALGGLGPIPPGLSGRPRAPAPHGVRAPRCTGGPRTRLSR